MLISVPAGHAADRLGARNTAIAFLAAQGVLICGYTLARSFVAFVVVAALVVGADSGANAARGALVAQAVAKEQRVKARAYLRSITNIGVSVGTVLGGIALQVNTTTMYVVMLLVAGAAFLAGAAVYLRIANQHSATGLAQESAWTVLRDRPFLAVAVINAVLVTNGGLLTVALPIWIAQQTTAPVAVYSAILLVNTFTVILFQVRASAGAEDVAGGARALRRSGLLLAGCCALFAAATGRPAWIAVVILLAGAGAHVVGEMLFAAGSWALSYELAPEHLQGQYQGLFGMTTKLAETVTPAVTTLLIIGLGWPGWLLFGALLVAAGALAPAAARWAQRTRPQPDVLLPAS
jgi:MFS family permease